jgi:hypothetical protein
MLEKIKPISLREIEEGQRIKGSVTLEVWFYVQSLDVARALAEILFQAEFVSVKPSNMISSVQIFRPNDQNDRIPVVARTDSQRVPVDLLKFFHEEMALIARQLDCCFGGSEMIGTANALEISEYQRQAREYYFGHTVLVH